MAEAGGEVGRGWADVAAVAHGGLPLAGADEAVSGWAEGLLEKLDRGGHQADEGGLNTLGPELAGQGEDVPRGVAMEWASWGRDPRYVFSYAEPRGGLGFASYSGPIRSVAVADDSYAPRAAVEALLAMYSAAQPELKVVQPNGAPIGHFGFFKQRTLWPEAAEWLMAA